MSGWDKAAEERATITLEKIDNYLAHGGLFNPEAMEHEKVRDLLLELRTQGRAALAELQAQRERAERLEAGIRELAKLIRQVVTEALAEPGKDLELVLKEVAALVDEVAADSLRKERPGIGRPGDEEGI